MTSSQRELIRDSAGIAALAILARLLFRLETGADPLFRILAIDGRSYVELARWWASGDWLWGTEPLWFAPLYPLGVGIVFRLFGPDPDLIRLLQHGLGVGSAVLAFGLAARFSRLAGWVAGGILALSPVLVFYENQLYYPSLAVFLTALFLLLLLGRKRFLVTGLVFGLVGLTRSNALLFLPVGAWWLWRRSGRRAALWFVTGTIAILTPVLLRNGIVGNAWTPLTVNGGMIFATGFGDEALGGRALQRRPEDFGPNGAFHREAERMAGRELSLAEASRVHRDGAREWIRSNPGATVRLTLRKVGLLFSVREIDDNLGFPLVRERAMSLAWWPGPWAWILVPGAVGAVRQVRRRGRQGEEARTLILYSMVYCVSLLMFFVNSRYRLPLIVPAAVFAGTAVADLWTVVRGRGGFRLREWIVPGIAGVICLGLTLRDPGVRADPALSLVAVGGALQDEGRSADALPFLDRAILIDAGVAGAHQNRALALRSLGRREEALAAAREAARLDPELAAAWMTVGALLAEGDRVVDAIPAFRRAAEIDPENPVALVNLAQALAITGRFDEAVLVGRRAERLGAVMAPSLRDWERQLTPDER
jgi:hypothetical protein